MGGGIAARSRETHALFGLELSGSLLAAALAAPAIAAAIAPATAHAAPPAERIGVFAEAGGGLNIAGAVDGETTGEPGVGAAFALRAGYRLIPYLALGAAAELATLPTSGLPTGNFTFAGAEIAGYLPFEPIELVAALALGYDLARGTYGDYSGFGGLRLRAGIRVPITRYFEAGADYALVMPRATDTVEADGETWRVEPAWLHQVSVVAVVPFW